MRIFVKKQPSKLGVKERLWIDFTVQGKRHRRSLKLDNTPKNKKIAETRILPEIQLKVLNGEFFKNKIPTVNEFAKTSFELHKVHRKETTHKDYLNSFQKYIEPVFGNKKLDLIKPSNITLFQNELIEKYHLSPKRVKSIRGILSVIFEDAIQDEIIDKNPVRKAGKLPQHISKEIEPFNIEEMNLIISHAQGQFKNFYAIAFYTGLRTGELIGLRWEDINFKTNEFKVNRTIGRGKVSSPKTNSSIRTVEMIDVVIPYFEDQFKRTGSKNDYLFLNQNDTHFFDSKSIREKNWKKTLENACVKYRTLYQTRHTFASMMISHGEDILWVSKMMGHATANMTLDKYAKYIKSKTKKRGQFLNEK
jgi:integrase